MADHQCTGSLELLSTANVLHRAADESGWIVNHLTAEAVYDAMRPFDDGLPSRDGRRFGAAGRKPR